MGRHVSFLSQIKVQKTGPGAKVFVQLTGKKKNKTKKQFCLFVIAFLKLKVSSNKCFSQGLKALNKRTYESQWVKRFIGLDCSIMLTATCLVRPIKYTDWLSDCLALLHSHILYTYLALVWRQNKHCDLLTIK